MRNILRRSRATGRGALAITTIALAVACTTAVGMVSAVAADTAYKVLVFSKTAGFRHDSIPAGITAIQQLGAANNFTVTATEDAAAFTTANLAQYQAVVFLSTTGDVLNPTQQTAFEGYINGGGGFVGIHAAADTEYDWPYYGNLVGAWFASHPAIQPATIKVEDRAHAATAHLGQTWSRTDELYNYRTNPRSTAHVLATLDESSYSGGAMGADHPFVWCKTVSAGRSFYTGSGHTQESYADPAFRSHLLGGIRYAAGKTKADCRAEVGYTDLYNGSTTGWSQAGPGGFTNSAATLTSFDGLGMLWYSAKEFHSYSLKLDWKLPGDDNSGVFIGFPASTDPWSAVNNGYEVQIDATDAVDRTTGSIYTFKAADIAARDAALNPVGEWNTYEILVEGERVQVFLNGVRINDFTNTDPVRSLQQGYIGIQNHGTGDDVSFRHVRIKELGAPPVGGTVQAEAFTAQSGIQIVADAGAQGGQRVGYIDNGDWIGFAGVNVSGATGVTLRAASGGTGGSAQVRSGSQTGPVLGTISVPNTGGYGNWATFTAPLTAGSGPLYLTFVGTGAGGLFDVDSVTLTTGGTAPAGTGPIRGLASKCLDVNNSGTADGTKIQLYTCNGTAAQQWTVTAGSTIKALGKCLDVAGGGSADGTLVQLWTCNASGAQNWQAQADGTVRNPQSGKCLDVSGASSADGAQIHLWTCTAAANQKWVLP